MLPFLSQVSKTWWKLKDETEGSETFKGASATREARISELRTCASVWMHYTATSVIEQFNPRIVWIHLNSVDVNILANSNLFRPSESILLGSRFLKLSPLRHWQKKPSSWLCRPATNHHGPNSPNTHLKYLGACKDRYHTAWTDMYEGF